MLPRRSLRGMIIVPRPCVAMLRRIHPLQESQRTQPGLLSAPAAGASQGDALSALCAPTFWWQSNDFAFREDFSNLLRIPRIVLYHSRVDEVVPFSHFAIFKEKLPSAIVRPLNGRGHEFNNEEFREIVEDTKSL